jgi:hypothetical protein
MVDRISRKRFLHRVASAMLLSLPACGSGANNAAPGDAGAAATDASLEAACDAASCDAGASESDAGAGSCSAIAPSDGALPHVVATGTVTAAVVDAIAAIGAAQVPQVSTSGITFPSLQCVDIISPAPQPSGFECTLDFPAPILGGGPFSITVQDSTSDAGADAGAPLAQNLFSALLAAGAVQCQTPIPGNNVAILNLIQPLDGDVQFDDASNYSLPSAPNVVVQGAAAQSVVAAFETAGINDCDPALKVFLVCKDSGGTPTCSEAWLPLQKVGSSELVPSCGGDDGLSPGATLSASGSLAIWQAVLAAATTDGFQPSSGTVLQMTLFNASFFSWDGTNLGFTLEGSNATPPPPLGGDDGGPAGGPGPVGDGG